MKTITSEDVLKLKADFDAYTKTAEQNEFPLLLIIERKMAQTFEVIEKDANYIEENQSELRAMFRVVLSVMGKDTSEYEEAPVKTDKELLRDYRNWANRKIRAIKDEKLKEEVRKCYLNSVEMMKKEESLRYATHICKKNWNYMVEEVKKKLGEQ